LNDQNETNTKDQAGPKPENRTKTLTRKTARICKWPPTKPAAKNNSEPNYERNCRKKFKIKIVVTHM